MNFVAIQCENCPVWIMCPVEVRPGMAHATPIVMLVVDKCPTCDCPFDPFIHSLRIPMKHKMPGGLIQ